jgi:ABC-type branched-subunit amino acid transport system ATPase component
MSDFALPDHVKEVISRLTVKDQGEYILTLKTVALSEHQHQVVCIIGSNGTTQRR